MTRYLLLFAASAVILFPLDFLWLSLTGKSLYRAELGDLMREQPNIAVAAGFYLAYVAGMVLLVTGPAEGDVFKALWMGAVLGLVAYGTYDLTNLSTMNGFTTRIAVIDMAWGITVSGLSAAGGAWLVKTFAG